MKILILISCIFICSCATSTKCYDERENCYGQCRILLPSLFEKDEKTYERQADNYYDCRDICEIKQSECRIKENEK